MRKIIATFFGFVLFLSADVAAQVINGPSIVCPGSTESYALSTWAPNTSYRWRLTKGNRSGMTEFCDLSAFIRWDNDLVRNGWIEVLSGPDCFNTPNRIATLNVRTFSFPAPWTASIPRADENVYNPLRCGVSETLSLYFYVPISEGDYGLAGSGWWTITATPDSVSVPSGWQVVSVRPIRDFNAVGRTFRKYEVVVRTNGATPGGVRVRTKLQCPSGVTVYGDWAQPLNLAFESVGIAYTGAPGEPTYICKSGMTTVGVSSSVATSYTWSAPPGFLINNIANRLTTTANTISLTAASAPNGAAGNLSVVANTACGSSSPLNISLYVGASPLALTASQTGCNGVAFTVTGTNATSFNWVSNGSLLFEGASTATTSSGYIDAVGSGDGIAVRTTDNCGSPVTIWSEYFPYQRTVNYASYLPLLPSDQLSVSVEGLPNYATNYKWYLNGVMRLEGPYATQYTEYDRWTMACGYNSLRLEVDTAECGTFTTADTEFERLCSSY